MHQQMLPIYTALHTEAPRVSLLSSRYPLGDRRMASLVLSDYKGSECMYTEMNG